jgi:lauroyl/myristoyl acyltransferase
VRFREAAAGPAVEARTAALLLVCGLLAPALPELLWPRAARTLVRAGARRTAGLSPAAADRLREVGSFPTAGAARAAFAAANVESHFGVMRALLPGGWRPSLSLTGFRALDEALRTDGGAVVLVADTHAASLVGKMALASHGAAPFHLSRSGHPFGEGTVVRWALNRVTQAAEDRYLVRRLRLDEPLAVGSLRRAFRALESGNVVSTNLAAEAAPSAEVTVFGGRLTVALGPFRLARRAGVGSFLLVPLKTGPGRYAATVERLEPPDGEQATLAVLAQEAARRLEALVRAAPEQWAGWRRLREPTPA